MTAKHHEPKVYKIYKELKKHVGKENAISGADLSAKFDISERQLRIYIREGRQSSELEKVIASDESGYYICRTKEEYLRVRDRLRATALDLLKTISVNDTKVGLEGQMKMELGAFYKDTFRAFGE